MSTTVFILLTNVNSINERMFSTVNKLSFSEWLNKELIERNMSQADLARKSKLTTGAISNFMNELRNPSPEALRAIAKAFDYPTEEIFRKAGLLPSLPEKDYLTEEAEFLLSQLTEMQRKQAVKFIRFLAEEKGEYNASNPMAEDG